MADKPRLIIGSRGSKLALWQANHVRDRLTELGCECEIRIIRTTGDKITDVALSQLGAKTGTKGLFTKEIEDALVDGSVDVAVHSLKDMPTELPGGLALTAIPEREMAFDALIGSTLTGLPRNAVVGTSSLRRGAQLRAARPDVQVEPLRGNLDTRLRKLDEGQYSAIMLAAAGLRRLGWADRITEILPPGIMCPAAGQGALAIETRADGGVGEQFAARLENPTTRAAVTAERALLSAMGGGCQAPLGAYAEIADGTLSLRGLIVSPDGGTVIRDELRGPVERASDIGLELSRRLLDAGGRLILNAVYGS